MKKLRADLIRFIRIKFYNLTEIEQEAEDIVNQTFLKACIKDYADLNFKYLAAIAVNEAIDRYKRQINQTSLELLENILHDEENHFAKLETEEDYQALALARENLKATENRIIQLHYYEGLSFTEIAEKLSMNFNTVLSHHRRSLMTMRNHFNLLDSDGHPGNDRDEAADNRILKNYKLL